jgi:hypothetical protein
MTTGRLGFRTRPCDLLAIDYPVLQSGMGLIAGSELVAEVSGAGALGIVAGFMLWGCGRSSASAISVSPGVLRRRTLIVNRYGGHVDR